VDYSRRTLKILFALSGNTCAFTGCEEKLTDPEWKQVKADICHICGRNPGSARYDAAMTEEERWDFANLILLCPNHHRLVDRLEPDNYSVELLTKMKQRHESRSLDRSEWATDEELEVFVRLAVEMVSETLTGESVTVTGQPAIVQVIAGTPTVHVSASESGKGRDDVATIGVGRGRTTSDHIGLSESLSSSASTDGQPVLTIEFGDDGRIVVVNVSELPAFGITVDPIVGREVVELAGISPPTIPAGERWVAGFVRRPAGSRVPVELRVHWRDQSGGRHDSDFSAP